MMKSALVAAAVLLAASLESFAQALALADTPPAIRELSATIQGMHSEEVRAAIIQKFGIAQRNVGSGFRIEQWDVEDGVLTFHPATGPTFKDKKTAKYLRLIQTHNTAGDNILTDYEMTTLPDPKYNGTRFWTGNLKFEAGGRYRFVESGTYSISAEEKMKVFFLAHPTGTVEVRYKAPVTAKTLLESLPENTVIAELVFTSEKNKAKETFSITSSERSRMLTFGGETPLFFMMDVGWRNFWE